MATREKRGWILALLILAGIVIGSLIGDLAKNISWLWWLSFGKDFGIETPLTLNLGVIILTFACMVKINIASIFGVLIAIFAYRKL